MTFRMTCCVAWPRGDAFDGIALSSQQLAAILFRSDPAKEQQGAFGVEAGCRRGDADMQALAGDAQQA